MKDSKFQERIYYEVVNADTNLIINAVAGSGKTTTLERCLRLLPDNKDIIFLAFNNAIVNELKVRIDRKDVSISTMHSFCWRQLMKAKGFKTELRPNKPIQYIKSICIKYNIEKKKHAYYFYLLSNIVNLMRMNMIYDVENIIKLGLYHDLMLDDMQAEMAMDLLMYMDRDDHIFDYTDMIYRVIKDNVKLSKFDYIFVDESQDLSILQQEVIKRIKKKEGRLLSVGDPKQAIYGFAGADVDSYNKLKNLFPNTVELPLSVNYRCGKRIIESAKKLNEQIEAFDKSPNGEVRNGFINEIRKGDWVLCRNLKPLILTNLYLLSIGKKCYVKGYDIGIGLNSLIMSLHCVSIKSMMVKYQLLISKERQKIMKLGVKNPDKTEKIDNMMQKSDILSALSKGLTTTEQLRARVKTIFKDTGEGIVLSTIHKAKGLENDNIFILCPELIPSQFATQEWQLQQENNLMYVAITRAKSKLIYISDYKETIENYKKELQEIKADYEE